MRKHPALRKRDVNSRYATGIEEVRGPAKATVLEVPSFYSVREEIESVPLPSPWMLSCENADTYLGLSEEFVTALSEILQTLPNPILEVGPRHSHLAQVLAKYGAPVSVIGSQAPEESTTDRFNVEAFSRESSYPTVMNAFAPPDSGVHQDVMHDSSVRSYLVLTARVQGVGDSMAMLNQRGWKVQPLPTLQQWMLTRNDMYVCEGRPLIRRGDAWLFSR